MILKVKITKCTKWKLIGTKGRTNIAEKQTGWYDLIIIIFIFLITY